MYKHTMNNAKLVDAVHKLLLPSSLCCVICGETKNYFHLNHPQAILFLYHAAKKRDIGCKNAELIYNHQSSKGMCRTGSYHHETCK